MEFDERLADAPSPTMTFLPDGSVDHRYEVLGRGDVPLARAEFAQRVANGGQSFTAVATGVEPGGKAVNGAVQADALGADATLFGHLDHDVFDEISVDARSMGAPATVNIYEFNDDAVMLTAQSADIRRWGDDELRAAGGERALDADAVVWDNWVSFPNATDALCRAAERDGDGGVFVFDPGDVTRRSAADVAELFGALGSLSERYEVVVTGNEQEVRALGDATGADGNRRDALRAVRERAGVAAAVLHGVDRAVAATADGTVVVENFDVASSSRFTGGGDRFSAGLAFALATGWEWEGALRLGNACASHYVETGSTGDADDLSGFVAEAETDA